MTLSATVAVEPDTPFFLLDTTLVTRAYERFVAAFPGADIFYAMKANAHPDVLRAIHSAGGGFEVASAGELESLIRLGVPSARITFGSAVKATSHIEQAVSYGVDLFALDSSQEIIRLATVAPGARVYVRVRVDDSTSVYRMSNKFGVEPNVATELLLDALRHGLVPYGLSFNVGSQAGSPSTWARGIERLASIIDVVGRCGVSLEVVNLGGGFPHAYVDSVAPTPEDIAAEVAGVRRLLPAEMRLMLEPGRGLVAECASLTVGVVARVRRRDENWLYLDAGTYNALFEAMVCQGAIRFRTEVVRPNDHTDELDRFVLTGPTGDGLDVVSESTWLPADTSAGDRLIFRDVGAYSLTLSSRFNGFETPPVLLAAVRS